MTEKLDALRELLAKVEAGEARQDDFTAAFPGEWPRDAMRAYHDRSFDAAMALHEAALPGWLWSVDSYGNAYVDGMGRYVGDDDNPARAWLVAILKALIAEARQ